MSNFTKICFSETRVVSCGRTDGQTDRQTGRQTDRQTAIPKLIVSLHYFANAPQSFFFPPQLIS